MGSPAGETGRTGDEGPRHAVSVVKPFALARCETTVGEFRSFVEETGYVTEAERGSAATRSRRMVRTRAAKGRELAFPGFSQDDSHPVVCVSFNDAKTYARWLGLRTGDRDRLPTEAEWEYAARAGTLTSRFWGDDPDAACALANGADRTFKARFPGWTVADCDDGALFTAPAGRYRRNPSACRTCWATSGSGWRTAGMRATKARRRTAAPGWRRAAGTAPGVCCAAALAPLPEEPPLRVPRQAPRG